MKITTNIRNRFRSDKELLDEAIFYWFYSFEEHLMSCDTCTLTWSEELCGEFIQFLKMVRCVEVDKDRVELGYDTLVKVEHQDIHLGYVSIEKYGLLRELIKKEGVELV